MSNIEGGQIGVAFQRIILLSNDVALARMPNAAWTGYVTEYSVEMGPVGMSRVLMRVELHPEDLWAVQEKMRAVLGEVQLELAMGTPPSVT